MFKKTLVASALAIALPAFAVDPSWTLSKDQVLNGSVESATDQELTYTLTNGKFGASSDSNSSFFMGELIDADNSSVINFQEVSADDVFKYVGTATSTGYQGTWHSTSGDSGDFGLNLNGNSTGGGNSGGGEDPDPGTGSGSLGNLDFGYKQEVSEGIAITGDYNHILTGYGGWRTANNDQAITSGKWYWEVEFKSGTYFLVGVDNKSSSGWARGKNVGTFYPAISGVFCGGSTITYGRNVNHGDIVSVMLDMDNKTIGFGINGENLGTACTGLPDTVYLATSVYTASETVETNFGQSAWAYPSLAQ